MSDVFKEQLVKKLPTTKVTIIKVGYFVVALILTVISSILMPSILVVVLAISFFGAYYMSTMLNKEFEYIYTNGAIDIDCIFNASKRKSLISFDVKEIELMTYIDNADKSSELNNVTSTVDYSSGVISNNTYCIILTKNGKKMKIIIEPNENILKAIETKLNRRVFIKKIY